MCKLHLMIVIHITINRPELVSQKLKGRWPILRQNCVKIYAKHTGRRGLYEY